MKDSLFELHEICKSISSNHIILFCNDFDPLGLLDNDSNESK